MARNRKPSPSRSLIFRLGVILGAPLLIATVAFFLLRFQPSRTWRALMPSQDFAAPTTGLRVLILTRDDARSWDMLHQSTYFYPGGSWHWLTLKEGLVPRLRARTANGLALAVAQDGSAWNYRGGSPENPITFEKLQDLPPGYSEAVQSALIVAENQAVYEAMRSRIPALRARQTFLTFEEAFRNPLSNPSAHFETQIKPHAIWRLLPIFGLLFALAALLFLRLSAIDLFGRLALTSLAVPLAYSLLAIAYRLGDWAKIPNHLSVVPILLWLTASGKLWFDWHKCSDKAFSPLRSLPTRLRLISPSSQALTAVAVVIALPLARTIFTSTLSTGDAAANTFLASVLYTDGRWDFAKFFEYPTLLNLGDYPQGVATLLTYLTQAIGPRVDKLYFPGHETGAIWILFGTWAVGMQAAFLAVAWETVRAFFPAAATTRFIFFILLVWAVPSVVGKLHSSEIFLWPLFATAGLMWCLYSKFRQQTFSLVAVTLTTGALYTKKESLIQVLLLMSPILFYAAATTHKNAGARVRACGTWLAMIGTLYAPYLIHQIQRVRVGLRNLDFHPFSWELFLENTNKIPAILIQCTKIFLSREDVRYVEWADRAAIGVVAFALIARLTLTRLRLVSFPIGIATFVFVFPAMYALSTYSNIPLHIATSWGRILVPVYSTLFIWLMLLVAEQKVPRHRV